MNATTCSKAIRACSNELATITVSPAAPPAARPGSPLLCRIGDSSSLPPAQRNRRRLDAGREGAPDEAPLPGQDPERLAGTPPLRDLQALQIIKKAFHGVRSPVAGPAPGIRSGDRGPRGRSAGQGGGGEEQAPEGQGQALLSVLVSVPRSRARRRYHVRRLIPSASHGRSASLLPSGDALSWRALPLAMRRRAACFAIHRGQCQLRAAHPARYFSTERAVAATSE